MNYEKKDVKIIIISGKARAGKDTTAGYIKKYYESKGKSVINLAFASTIKEYAKKLTDWDGSDETKPRELLQVLGTEIIRKKIDNMFFIKRMIQDIEVYSYFYDVITISDSRLVEEIESICDKFLNVVSVNIVRPEFVNELTGKEKKHLTEVGLDNYDGYDYEIINDGTLEELEKKVIDLLKEVDER